MVIIGVLSGMAFAGYGAAMSMAHKAKEIGAGKSLMVAYLNYPADHDGELLAGYQPGASVTLPGGDVVSGPTAERYPWRLADYANLSVENTFFLNPAKQGGSNNTNLHYMVSLVPSLGLNAYCIGGYQTSSGYLAKADCVTNLQQVNSANVGQLIVFASAQLVQGKTTYEGNFIIKPSTMSGVTAAKDGSIGNVQPRYNGKAVVAYFDGHVEVNKPSELMDSRKWSPTATTADQKIKP